MANVLITGANRGIGLELTRIAVARGDRVIGCCRHPSDADALQQLGNAGKLRVMALTVDAPDSIAALAADVGDDPIDILINNAGVMGPPPEQQSAFEMDYDAWRHCHEVNAIGPVRLTHALLPQLEKASPAKVVSISSQMGALSVDMRFALAYSSSKAALNKVMRLMAAEFAERGILISLVHPGWVRTDMGGADADISPGASARGIWDVIDGLQMADAGEFFSWRGEKHPW